MKRLSLTARMSLMFMLAVITVLTLAGLSFNGLSRHHFKALDRQALDEKLASTQQVLGQATSRAELVALLPQLNALLGAHQDLTAIILDQDDTVLFAEPSGFRVAEPFWRNPGDDMWELEEGGRRFRGLTAQVAGPEPSTLFRVLLVLDVTHHEHFLATLRHWFWIGLIISAMLSAALGWLVARSGLRPLRQVTLVATAMSARSLNQRIPLEPVPFELQQLVNSFNAMLARLDDAFVRLSNFSADIAHELRTPVTNLLTHTEVVLTQKRNVEAYEDNLYSNLEELKRMSRMIDDMLFLAKADNGLIIAQQAPVELGAVAAKLIEYYRLLAEERGIQLELQGAGCILGDSLMLERALSNLLSNALRYTESGQSIAVNIRQLDDRLGLSVENPGPTIDPQHLHQLFDRFYRVDPARREGSPSNAGLGLAITRSIVEAHQGTIRCTSDAGLTTFHMEFPMPRTKSSAEL